MAEFRHWVGGGLLAILIGGSVLSLIIRSWTWSPMKDQREPRAKPPADETLPAERMRMNVVTTVALIGFVVGNHLVTSETFRAEEIYAPLTMWFIFCLYDWLRRKGWFHGLVPLVIGGAMLGAVHLIAGHAPQQLALLGRIMLAAPVLAVTFLPSGQTSSQGRGWILPLSIVIILVWAFLDWPALLYLAALILIPLIVRRAVRTLADHHPCAWTLAVRRAVTGR